MPEIHHGPPRPSEAPKTSLATRAPEVSKPVEASRPVEHSVAKAPSEAPRTFTPPKQAEVARPHRAPEMAKPAAPPSKPPEVARAKPQTEMSKPPAPPAKPSETSRPKPAPEAVKPASPPSKPSETSKPDPAKKDVSNQFTYKTAETKDRTIRTVEGKLGVSGEVQSHRNETEQKKLSTKTGDHAGHLAGARFGASGTRENLGLQNKDVNMGTQKRLESSWARQQKEGADVHLKMTETTKKGDARFFYRKAESEIRKADGTSTKQELLISNPHTAESRKKQNIAPTVSEKQHGNVVNVDFKERRKNP